MSKSVSFRNKIRCGHCSRLNLNYITHEQASLGIALTNVRPQKSDVAQI